MFVLVLEGANAGGSRSNCGPTVKGGWEGSRQVRIRTISRNCVVYRLSPAESAESACMCKHVSAQEFFCIFDMEPDLFQGCITGISSPTI